MKKTKNITESINFENSLTELEKIVETMEKGDLSLEDSLKYFEQGINLTRHCQESLKDAEQKVKILSEQSQNANLKKYEIDEQEKPKDNA